MPQPTTKDRIVVFAPHPDDETSLVGGYIRAAAQVKSELTIVVVTDGNAQGQAPERLSELKAALKILGVITFQQLSLPDGQLEQHPAALQEKFRQIIDQTKPTVVIFPHPADAHTDHAAVGRAILAITDGGPVQRYAYLDHFPPRLPYPRGYYPNLFTWAPSNLKNNWVTFSLSAEQQRLKEHALRAFAREMRRPILKSHLVSTIRRNEIFAEF